MTTLYVCDGCGTTTENPVKLGHALKREYCETCAPNARGFVMAEEQLRVGTQKAFADGRDKLIEQHSANGFKLPDVIHAG